ncbi:MAG: bifunctional DNA-formamidopyrimidine glycosylase/DNA-(apurinic or apyrimidinic site) lyase [Syntrophales bacterium]|nr:bifunctional DNA-formamidopyrimidine glycosylase/DNA-(apurinic or apyrimidinic site) lyase [Syntrophales bacterium]
MPELPEVETLRRQLEQIIVGKRIRGIEVMDSKIATPPSVSGQMVSSVHRRGKGLEVVLDSGMALHLHLRMSGKLLWQSSNTISLAHTRLVISFEEGCIILIDPRRFATLSYNTATSLEDLPGFPLRRSDLPRILSFASKRRIPIKAFLLDQRIISGIGNIYACEILHEAAVDPFKRTCDLSTSQWQRIIKVSAPILKMAIRARGTTVSDWRDLFGRKGEYQRQLKVYAHEGEPCPRCGSQIVRERISGRGTYYCASCQK